MKPIVLSLLTDVFSKDSSRTKSKTTINRIFITDTDPQSERTIMIEEDEYSIWAYLLQPDMQGIDFDGFICAVIDPKTMKIDPKDATKNGNATPLDATFSNQYSYVKGIKKEDINVSWKPNKIEVLLKKELYLIMDIETKTSYSKALASDCYYGNKLNAPA
ncbi:hypothetical protein GCM10022393_22390 [Aquimarina addita]|uniref:Uncharacterized protein n=1 Tax=Aquimarina addita TaxID=870485 RepID=A0ABP6ULY6_9FLAO